MLDLITLFASMGIQEEMKEIRRERDASIVNNVEETESNGTYSPFHYWTTQISISSPFSLLVSNEVVEGVESGLAAVESCVASVVTAVVLTREKSSFVLSKYL